MTVFRWQDLLNSTGEFSVPPQMWVEMNACMSRDEIVGLLQDAVDNTGMAFPFRQITLDRATDDFRKLKFLDTSTLATHQTWTTDFSYRYGFQDVVVGRNTVGSLSSDFFHQQHRYGCDMSAIPSALRGWADRGMRRGLFRALWTLNLDQVTPSEIRAVAANRKYVAAQYRPSAAKYIYDRYAGGGRVLDFSAGWGDRLSAALASDRVTHYTGIDPNTNLHAGYKAQVEAYNRPLNGDLLDWFAADTFEPKSVKLIHSPAEDVDLDGPFDLVFTSPPYFDKERYTKESTQSWVRYKTLSQWLNGFMYPVLQKVWDRLVPGGHLCVNISDIRLEQRVPGTQDRIHGLICDPMNDHIGTLPGANYLGALGMAMMVRPNPRDVQEMDKFCEPMWLWQKK